MYSLYLYIILYTHSNYLVAIIQQGTTNTCTCSYPRHTCARVTVVIVCLCATYYSCYIPRLNVEIKVPLSFLCHFLHMHCVDFGEIFYSEVLATFADHLCLIRFLTDFQWTNRQRNGLFSSRL